MISPFIFTHLPQIYFGAGSFSKLTSVVADRTNSILLVTGGKSFRKSDKYNLLLNDLSKKNIRVFEEQVSGEPSPSLIDSICEKYRRFQPGLVLAIGGGSVLDAGKAISAMLLLNDSVVSYLEGVGDKKHPGTKVPFIAVPTTSGTGSEATKNAVLSETGKNGYKRSLRHDNFIPDIAIVDPLLTLTCPTNITAACGLDALTQLVEPYFSTQANPMTDALALSGLKEILQQLPLTIREPENIKARTGVAYASLISGICLAQSGLGVVHGFASPIGAFFDVPHGVVCGTLLGASLRANVKKMRAERHEIFLHKMASVGRLLTDDQNKTNEEYIHQFLDTIDEWTDSMQLPMLSKYGVTENDFDRIIHETGLKNNPVVLDKTELAEILKARL